MKKVIIDYIMVAICSVVGGCLGIAIVMPKSESPVMTTVITTLVSFGFGTLFGFLIAAVIGDDR